MSDRNTPPNAYGLEAAKNTRLAEANRLREKALREIDLAHALHDCYDEKREQAQKTAESISQYLVNGKERETARDAASRIGNKALVMENAHKWLRAPFTDGEKAKSDEGEE